MSVNLPESLDDQAELLRVFAHPMRLMILKALASGELSVSDLAERIELGQPTLSQQLAVLRKAALVTTRREAKQVFYSVDAGQLAVAHGIVDTVDPGAQAEQSFACETVQRRDAGLGAAMFAQVSRNRS